MLMGRQAERDEVGACVGAVGVLADSGVVSSWVALGFTPQAYILSLTKKWISPRASTILCCLWDL